MKPQTRPATSLVLQLRKETVKEMPLQTGVRAGVGCPLISHLCAITIFVPPGN